MGLVVHILKIATPLSQAVMRTNRDAGHEALSTGADPEAWRVGKML